MSPQINGTAYDSGPLVDLERHKLLWRKIIGTRDALNSSRRKNQEFKVDPNKK